LPLGKELAHHLPFLRRYARALTGSQAKGDDVVKRTLDMIVADQGNFPRDIDLRLALYASFLDVWENEADADYAPEVDGDEAIVRRRLALITPRPRQALLLTAMEGFTPEDAGYLMDIERSEVEALVAEALTEIERQTKARVLIIEDEPIIAMDIETMVTDIGHDVCAITATHAEAVEAAKRHRPTLVLADVQLADDSSGIDAVYEILADFKVPTIFITAFPERLLTGDRPEPTFLITKPFQRSTVKAAIAQALFFDEATVPA
jgi:DNA-directed RNA polymerase specialized sigma24 family protein/CheY-like chemotaxis protein